MGVISISQTIQKRKNNFIYLEVKKPVAEVKEKFLKTCSPSSGIPRDKSKQFCSFKGVMCVVEIKSSLSLQAGFTKAELQNERL